MKPFLCLLAFSFSTMLFSQEIPWHKFSAELQIELEKKTQEPLQVIIALQDQLDADVWLDSFRIHRTTFHDRATAVNHRLTEVAQHSQQAFLPKLKYFGIEPLHSFRIINAILVEAPARKLIEIAAAPEILYMELDMPMQVEEPISIEKIETKSDIRGTREPGLGLIKAPQIWKRGYTGYGRKGMIMDTGIDWAHPALNRNYGGHVFPEEQIYLGATDFFDRIVDCGNHGTHVAGTILGIDRIRKDTIGVAYNAMWMGGNAIGRCAGFSQALILFEWALNPDGNPDTSDDMPDVINNSWFTRAVEDCDFIFEQMFTVLEAAGIAVVFSAGNEGPGTASITRPKNINKDLVNTFTVGSINAGNLWIANSSSRGPSRCGGEGSLLLKPEVSAPGVNVRSCVPGNGYAIFSGTSMAAPHAAGAVLLLKEAFPYLSGEDVKLALYYSATDLGDPGEDNTYGMGLIDVDAAFQYLVDEGYEPVKPTAEIDLVLEHIDMAVDQCSGELTLKAWVSNNGTLGEEGYILELYTNESSTEPIFTDTIEQSILAGESLVNEFNFHLAEEGSYRYWTVLKPLIKEDQRMLNNTLRLQFDYLKLDKPAGSQEFGVSEENYCSGTSVILGNDIPGVTLTWYDELDPSQPFFTGNLLKLQLPDTDTTIVLETGVQLDEVIYPAQNILQIYDQRPFDYTGPVLLPLVDLNIQSLTVDCKFRTFLTIAILDEFFDVLWLDNRSYPAGENIIPINYTIPAERLAFVVVRANREINMSLMEPETDSKLLRFIGYVLNEIPSQEWLFPFYDLTVSMDLPCSRTRTILNVNETESVPEASFFIYPTEEAEAAENQLLTFINTSKEADHFEWDFGDGTLSVEVEPDHFYTSAGSYFIQLKARDASGCIDMAGRWIDVAEDAVSSVNAPIIDNNTLQFYPNPAGNEIFISLDQSITHPVDLYFYNVHGQLMYQVPQIRITEDHPIELSEFTSGWYFVKAIHALSGYTAVGRFQIVR